MNFLFGFITFVGFSSVSMAVDFADVAMVNSPVPFECVSLLSKTTFGLDASFLKYLKVNILSRDNFANTNPGVRANLIKLMGKDFVYQLPESSYYTIVFNSNRSKIAVIASDFRIYIGDVNKKLLIRRLEVSAIEAIGSHLISHKDVNVAFHPNEDKIAIKVHASFVIPGRPMRATQGSVLDSGTLDQYIIADKVDIVDFQTGKLLNTNSIREDQYSSLRNYAPVIYDGQFVGISERFGIRVWDTTMQNGEFSDFNANRGLFGSNSDTRTIAAFLLKNGQSLQIGNSDDDAWGRDIQFAAISSDKKQVFQLRSDGKFWVRDASKDVYHNITGYKEIGQINLPAYRRIVGARETENGLEVTLDH
jgi:hypothetical protein